MAMMAQDQPPPTESETTVGVPAPLGGMSPRVLPTLTERPRNILMGSVGADAVYDDNGVPESAKPTGAYQYSISPYLSLQRSQAHSNFALDYRGGVTFNQRALDQTLDTQSVAADFQHRFTRKWLMELREDYLRTSNPFTTVGENQLLPTLSGNGQPASQAATLAATRTANSSFATLTYQLGPHSILGVSGNYSTERFNDVAATPGASLHLIESDTTVGQAFYALRISQSQNIGGQYQIQDLKFESGQARTVGQTFFLFDEITIKPHVTLTLFGGPEYSHTHNNVALVDTNQAKIILPVLKDEWSPAGGAMLTVRAKRAAVRLTGQRSIGGGGASIGAAHTTGASAELQTDLTQRWSSSLGAVYSDGSLLQGSTSGVASRTTTLQGTVAVSRRITRNLVAQAQYAHIHQFSASLQNSSVYGDHNRVGVGLAYQFTRPLSR